MTTFLSIPIEIREKIYREILPRTTSKACPNDSTVTWLLGDMTLLATCRQAYEECARIVYGDNVFDVAVESARTVFLMFYLSGYGVMRQQKTYDLYEFFTDRTISRIRNLKVTVVHHADFTSMTKYNCGGRALNHVLRSQVEALVDALDRAEPLRWMQIRFLVTNGLAKRITNTCPYMHEGKYAFPFFLQDVLLPFSQLSHVRDVAVTGAVTAEFAKALEFEMSRILWLSSAYY